MGGQTSMGGAATPQTHATGIPATGMPQGGGFDLSKLFMGNQANTPAAGGQALPQIMAPPRQPMPVMPQRTPMPQMQAPAIDPAKSLQERFRGAWANYNQLNPVERARVRNGGGR